MFTEECKTHNPNTHKKVIFFMPNAIDLTYATEMYLKFLSFFNYCWSVFRLENKETGA